jgi:LysM repeat protein
MRKIILIFLAFCFVLPVIFSLPRRSSAQAGDASQLIAEVNALRSAYGLAPYEAHNSLMSAAQQHSNYQATIGTWTHSGPGGSRPHDRAVAAGYGGGAQVFVSENVAMGVNLSPARTVNEMWQDAVHLETMISSLYTHIGAGVGQAGDYVYYTIVVGYIAGSAGSVAVPGDQDQPVDTGENYTPLPSVSDTTPLPTADPADLISTIEPSSDGSIQHVVQPGQFLANIARAYEIELSDLLELNSLSQQSVIYPGDKLLIKAGSRPMPVLRLDAPIRAPQEVNLPTSTATSQPRSSTSTPTPAPIAMPSTEDASPTVVATRDLPVPVNDQGGNVDYLLYVVIGFAVSGIALILFGSALKRQT